MPSDPSGRLQPEPIGENDRPQLLDLIASAYLQYGIPFDPDAPEEAHVRTPGPTARENGGELWVVRHDGVIRASCAVHLADDEAGRVGEIKTMYVHQTIRRVGVGRMLLDTAIDHARRSGAMRMVLWTDTMLVDAHPFYERAGFTRFGQRHIEGWSTFEEYGYEMTL